MFLDGFMMIFKLAGAVWGEGDALEIHGFFAGASELYYRSSHFDDHVLCVVAI